MISQDYARLKLMAGTRRTASSMMPECATCGCEIKIGQKTVLLKHKGYSSLIYHYDCMVDMFTFLLENRREI